LLDIIKTKINSGYIKSVLILVGGSGLAQVINISILPLLTRLYSPSDFSMLAVYVAIVSISSTAACLRFDITIPLPKYDASALNLLVISISLAFISSVIIFFILWFFKTEFLVATKLPAWVIYLIPIGVFSAACYNSLQYWFSRKKQFNVIAKTRITQASSGAIVQVYGGLVASNFLLLLGHLATSSVGILAMLSKLLAHEKQLFSKIKISTIKALIRKYEQYPKYSTLEVLANNAGIQLPIILIASFTLGEEAGYLMLAIKAMQAPMALIGGSVAQVYYSHAAIKNKEGQLSHFTSDTLKGLMKTGVGPIIFAGIVAPQVFSLIFGADWQRAGVLVSWMTLWFALQFLASPISMVMHVKNKQKHMLILTITGFIIRLGSVLLAYYFVNSRIAEVYALSGAVFYFICLVVFSFWGLSRLSIWWGIIKSGVPIIMVWALMGGLAKASLLWLL
jgi:O-antigen/teichoic acid export membrane protein